MSKTKSPITGKIAKKAFVKDGVQYYTDDLGNIFCKKLDQSGMVGGGKEDERNTDEMNLVRMYRIQKISGKQQPTILDYGCGTGLMVTYMQDAGIDCDGYDPYNGYYADVLSLKKDYDVIVLTEVIEHLTAPFAELAEIKELCHKGSKVMIETSFADWLTEHDEYIEPKVGHCTIFSHAGLDHLMAQFGFKPDNHINRNVRIYAVG
jgi:SAM-dependent methyltransferase